ncbi:uncharacterized protein [Temnothorax longispinosus]|uniref:uncharacterized protein n=1 Tax=Temnothorax longispinosus TaxID=300112 RepID=UPI003A995969
MQAVLLIPRATTQATLDNVRVALETRHSDSETELPENVVTEREFPFGEIDESLFSNDPIDRTDEKPRRSRPYVSRTPSRVSLRREFSLTFYESDTFDPSEYYRENGEETRTEKPLLEERTHTNQPQAQVKEIEMAQSQSDAHGGDYANAGTSGDTRAAKLVWREINAAFKKRIITGAVINIDHIEPRQFLEDACSVVCKQVRDIIKTHNCVKVNTAFNGEFVAGDKRDNKSICTNNIELCRTSHLREWYELHVIEPTLAKLEEFQERDSGWALTRILNLTVSVNKYNPLRAGCHLELPKDIKVKNAVINVLSMDNACFAWSVVAALHPTERHSERESSYPHYSTVLNVRDIEFPMTLSQIKKFERLNNISVNVYTIEGKKTSNVLPIRLTDRTSVKKHVNLLYVPDPRDNNVGHFAWIKHLSRLVSSQLSKHHGQKYICDR